MSTEIPLACNPGAIPEGERAAHFALARRLFGGDSLAARELPTGREYRFPAAAFAEVARFVENERKCCPFLAFTLVVEPGEDGVRIQMTGPAGTVQFLNAQLPLPEMTHV